MGKQPYIPVYIGDWEQDLNCVSLEAEGAALKLVFKLWKSPTRGLLSFCFTDLAFLFKKSDQETRKIIAELRRNNIFSFKDLTENEIEISSRRMLRELELSRVRSDSGKEGGRGKKKERKQNKSKSKPKPNQIPEYEGEGDNEIGIDYSLKKSEKTFLNGSTKIPPSPAMVERPFLEAGLTAEAAQEFFNDVEGRTGWANIHDWEKYTLAGISKRLKQKFNGKTTGNNSNRRSDARRSIDEIKHLANEILRNPEPGNGR